MQKACVAGAQRREWEKVPDEDVWCRILAGHKSRATEAGTNFISELYQHTPYTLPGNSPERHAAACPGTRSWKNPSSGTSPTNGNSPGIPARAQLELNGNSARTHWRHLSTTTSGKNAMRHPDSAVALNTQVKEKLEKPQ
ncbi:uncharacterized protein ACOB7L_004513 [Callospermophilus lateralis]|uniref:uncharacterized protein LOC143639434 n=1 Tax=Callospermophilus lateralis TaxID=76772 RepID=UPI004053FD84